METYHNTGELEDRYLMGHFFINRDFLKYYIRYFRKMTYASYYGYGYRY